MPLSILEMKNVAQAGSKKSSNASAKDSQKFARFDLSKQMAVFPDRAHVILVYSESVTITSGTVGVAGVYVFAANGLYDPNITGTGHQPVGFDQMMLFYNHYVVVRSRFKGFYRSATANYGGYASVAVKGTSTTVTDATRLVEDGYVKYHPLGIPSSSTAFKSLEMPHNTAAFQGVVDPTDNPDLAGDSAANPAEITYFHLSYWNDLDNTAISCQVNVLIEYEVVFREPRPLTQS